jgi:hypothetical protein
MIAQAKMQAVNTAPDAAFEPPVRTLKEYLATAIEVPPVLITPNLLVRGGVNATIGRAGKGKTVMNLNRTLRWAAGKPMFDNWRDSEGQHLLAPERPLRILIVENEGAAGMFHKQVGIMLHADGFLTAEERDLASENTLVWGEGGYSDLKLDDPNKLNGLRMGVEKHKPDIVFIEPFRSLWKGEENSSTEMQIVVDALIGIATDYECGCILAHHEKKGGGEDREEKMNAARGSSVLEGAVTAMENFESVKGGDYRELSWSKSRHGKAPNPVRMEWVADAWWYKHVPLGELDEQIIATLSENGDEPMNVADLQEALDENRQKLRTRLKILADEGRVRKLSSISGPGGSSGFRYSLPMDEDTGYGGLAV